MGIFMLGLLTTFLLQALSVNADAADRQPLLQAGKKTLFQRGGTQPGAKMLSGPDSSAQAVQNSVKTFSVFYVYARNNGFL